jgi:hypothetical protein
MGWFPKLGASGAWAANQQTPHVRHASKYPAMEDWLIPQTMNGDVRPGCCH